MKCTTARLAGALVVSSLVLAGCADDSSDAVGHGSMMSGSTSASPSVGLEADHNAADVEFASGVIPHHMQAIAMSRLATDRAVDLRVEDLAARIEAAQTPEIETLSSWLEQWGAEPDMGGMDHGGMGASAGMGGMMSEQDMHDLMAASGVAFDRLFLQQMTVHHQGAVTMAETEIADGQNADAIALAESIRDSQTAEIAEMQQLLTELGG
ncbi:Uncharacterized conserved protein, DUF305 family [Geodermatophilus obscurus]|uniref:Uncharacterized conserved protein, DUF305 family n=1 Tax=Geodermatophilus obscurus TaxID=1861 RepID=A0A1M7U619_9ACTN|nr:DUF305 domain-containing protein [Geodermatophilus obscurus]SHN78398.1 Uncharacterized conserved protein, DUF305 family [Geodermatophilus obscurus]